MKNGIAQEEELERKIIYRKLETNTAKLTHLPQQTDQARPEADPCRSAYTFQGHRCHR